VRAAGKVAGGAQRAAVAGEGGGWGGAWWGLGLLGPGVIWWECPSGAARNRPNDPTSDG
jgi:hypothetical protein